MFQKEEGMITVSELNNNKHFLHLVISKFHHELYLCVLKLFLDT